MEAAETTLPSGEDAPRREVQGPRDGRGDGAAGSAIRYMTGRCALGSVLVARSEHGLCAVLLGDDPTALVGDLRRRFADAEPAADRDATITDLTARVVALAEDPASATTLPLDARGTAFQRRVWAVLREIPAGETLSYAQVADRIGSPRSVRAVAQACGANMLAIVVPCHRVVRSDGGLAGYRWGVERKRALLRAEREAAAARAALRPPPPP